MQWWRTYNWTRTVSARKRVIHTATRIVLCTIYRLVHLLFKTHLRRFLSFAARQAVRSIDDKLLIVRSVKSPFEHFDGLFLIPRFVCFEMKLFDVDFRDQMNFMTRFFIVYVLFFQAILKQLPFFWHPIRQRMPSAKLFICFSLGLFRPEIPTYYCLLLPTHLWSVCVRLGKYLMHILFTQLCALR